MKFRLFAMVTMLNLFLLSGFPVSAVADKSKVTYLLTVEVTPKDSQIKILNSNVSGNAKMTHPGN